MFSQAVSRQIRSVMVAGSRKTTSHHVVVVYRPLLALSIVLTYHLKLQFTPAIILPSKQYSLRHIVEQSISSHCISQIHTIIFQFPINSIMYSK
jgi:hypothetical protein